MTAAVVIATYNERENLAFLASAILEHPGYRIIVVDDDSPDGTGDLADELAAGAPGRIAVIHRRGARGLGRSLVAGLKQALADGDADLIFQMDADFSHDPKYLPDMAAAAADADLVLGSRYLHGVSVVNWPLHRIILSAFANRYIRAVTGLEAHDCTTGYRCWRREALARLPLDTLDLGWIRVPGRTALPREAIRVPCAGGADHLRRAAARRLEGLVGRPARVSDRSVATAAKALTQLLLKRTAC